MIRNFNFSKIPDTIFGIGSVDGLNKHIVKFGTNIMLITGFGSYSETRVQRKVEKNLSSENIKWERYSVSGEPSPQMVDGAVLQARKSHANLVVAVGGGSVIDTGKAVAAMVKETGSVADYLEGVGTQQPSGNRLPLIAVPTTSGTGSEATKNAVISELGPGGFKKSLRHPNYIPDIAIIDPELTIDCPSGITASSGLDAYTQLLESYLSTAANEMTDALALSGLKYVDNSLFAAYRNGNDLSARSDMAYSAYLSGITLANAGLGAIHGFAQPLGSLFAVPHGIVCGTLMAETNRITVKKLAEEGPGSLALQKYARVGQVLSGYRFKKSGDSIQFLIDRLTNLVEDMSIPPLRNYGIVQDDIPAIISKTGLKNHPVALNHEELAKILHARI